MFKKNSWIVALLLALTLTALFTGCIDALADAEAGMTYTEVALGDFNVWGGQGYQRGWAVGGLKFLGVGDKSEVAADKGYKNEDFAKATKLVIEMEDATHPSGNLDIIWGAANEKGDSVGKDWIQTGGIKSSKEGNILTIDLTAMKDYASYKGGNYAMRKLVLQAGGEKGGLPFVKKAKLLIPDKVPFVAVTGMSLTKSEFPWTGELKLEGVFTPEDATNQIVNWSIKSWTPVIGTKIEPVYPAGQGTDSSKPDYNVNFSTELAAYNTAKTALLAKVDFKPKTLVIRPAEIQKDTEVWDYSVLPPVKVTIASDTLADIPGQTYAWHEDDVIVATDGVDSMGTVVVIATVVNGKSETENFVKELTVTIIDQNAFSYKVDGTTKTTVNWGGQANSGASSEMAVATSGDTKYTITMTGNSYGNAYHYVRYDLGSGKTISDFAGIKFTYKSVSGDANFKTVRVKGLDTAPPSGYNPGLDVSRLKTGDAKDGVELFATFGDNEDDPDNVVEGAYAANLTTLDTDAGRYVYLWFLPWSDGTATVFEISNVEILTTAP